MVRKRKHTNIVMFNTVTEILKGTSTVRRKAHELGVNVSTIRRWLAGYQSRGIEYFESHGRNKSYTKATKEMVIQEYLDGMGSSRDLALKHGILSDSTILSWVRKYNRLEVIKDYDPKGEVYMAKGRKVNQEEKLEIVKYCIDNSYDYKGAVSAYKVSYAQIYSWTRKYLKDGKEGLIDNRGKRKDEIALTELEQLQRENKLLKEQLERKNMENILLKKLKEVERRGFSHDSNKKQNT